MSPTSAIRLSPDLSKRDALMTSLVDAHRHLAGDNDCATKLRLVLMLTAVAEHLSLSVSEIMACRLKLNYVMETPVPLSDELVSWCLEQLKDAVSGSSLVDPRCKTRTLRLIDVFGNQNTFCGLVHFYQSLERLRPFKEVYSTFAVTWSTDLLMLFKAQLDLALTRHPNSATIIEVVREIDETDSPVLMSDTVIDLVIGLRNGSLNNLTQLAERWRNRPTFLERSERLREAVADLAIKEPKWIAEAERLQTFRPNPQTAHLGPIRDAGLSGGSSF